MDGDPYGARTRVSAVEPQSRSGSTARAPLAAETASNGFNGLDDRGQSPGAGSGAFELMHAGDDGWSDWIHPLPGYLMKCCDCGLVHEMEVAIGETDAATTIYNSGEGPDRVVLFRMRREPSL